jgi:hypothetical protein
MRHSNYYLTIHMDNRVLSEWPKRIRDKEVSEICPGERKLE